jgi:hypothetical protein
MLFGIFRWGEYTLYYEEGLMLKWERRGPGNSDAKEIMQEWRDG